MEIPFNRIRSIPVAKSLSDDSVLTSAVLPPANHGQGLGLATTAAILALNVSALTYDLAIPAPSRAEDEVGGPITVS